MYLSNDLVTSVKSRVNVPLSQITFQAADLYRFADEEIKAKLIPLILRNLEEYYVRFTDVTIISGTNTYSIPTRAIASKLRDVNLVSSDGLTLKPLERLSPDDLSGVSMRRGLKKSGFYLQGNQVVLYNVGSTGTQKLRMSYYIRPSTLIDVTAAAQIASIDTTLKTVSVFSLPTGFSASAPIDFVKSQPGFENPAIDQSPVGLAGNVFTFASIPSDLSVGDYICPANQSCIVQVPPELQPLLFQYVAIRILSAQSDLAPLKVALAELKELENAVMMLISPRVDGKSKKAISGRGIGRYL